ncbi:MAG: hypothetical protein DMD35_08615 [Gemmatimonadetes bacterium]|nr:MAG: hypothetical protein DMD35_08615 [Gemmatimonadota bacterium]
MHAAARASLIATLVGISVLGASRDARAQTAPTPARGTLAGRSVRGALSALDAAARERQARREEKRYDPIFQKYAKRYFGAGTDWQWFKAQGMAESDLTPTARSRVGARGIMQLMPSRREFSTTGICGPCGERTSRRTSAGRSCSRATTPARGRSCVRVTRPNWRGWIIRDGRRSRRWPRRSSGGATARRSATCERSTRTRAHSRPRGDPLKRRATLGR